MIVFTENINGILNAYNNNVVRFKSDSEVIVVNADITINGYSFQITPFEGEFYFNFKTIIQKLINSSCFVDACPYAPVADLWADVNAGLNVSVEYKINFIDLSSETEIVNYNFVKGVNQVTEKALYNNRGESFPLHLVRDNIVHLTYFKGYPFTFSLFGENITFLMKTRLSEPEFLAAYLPALNFPEYSFTSEVPKGVHRYILSDGLSQLNRIDDKYHLISFGDYLIKLKVEEKCGTYLKWHNQYGGWDYWMFEKNAVNSVKDKSRGSVYSDFDNLPDANPFKSMGKTVDKTVKLFANGVYDYEIDRVLGVLNSPKVYLYIGKEGDQHNQDNWIEVEVKGKSTSARTLNHRHTISLNVTMPKPYTLYL